MVDRVKAVCGDTFDPFELVGPVYSWAISDFVLFMELNTCLPFQAVFYGCQHLPSDFFPCSTVYCLASLSGCLTYTSKKSSQRRKMHQDNATQQIQSSGSRQCLIMAGFTQSPSVLSLSILLLVCCVLLCQCNWFIEVICPDMLSVRHLINLAWCTWGFCAVFGVPAVDSLLRAQFCLLDSHCVDLSALFPVFDFTAV